jgi:Co/Zn/Cd efflux system component
MQIQLKGTGPFFAKFSIIQYYNYMPKSRIIAVILLNTAIVLAEIYFGVLGNSMALIADALHNFGDVLSIVIAFIAFVYSEKKASRSMTYGYVRSEMMAGFINSLFLVLTDRKRSCRERVSERV